MSAAEHRSPAVTSRRRHLDRVRRVVVPIRRSFGVAVHQYDTHARLLLRLAYATSCISSSRDGPGTARGGSLRAIDMIVDKAWPSEDLLRQRDDPDDVEECAINLRVVRHRHRQGAAESGCVFDGGGTGCPSMIASISACRSRSTSSVARYQGVNSASVIVSKASASRLGVPSSDRTMSRIRTACRSPREIPRPNDGLVHAHASPTARTPVATGRPSTTKRR